MGEKLMNPALKKTVPGWVKILVAGGVGAGAVTGGQKLATDSPVHFMAEGAVPASAPDWSCAPEGGIIGAPVVCRPKLSAPTAAASDTSTQAQ